MLTRQELAERLSDNSDALRRRLLLARASLSGPIRQEFRSPVFDFANKRMISTDGRYALQWRVRERPDLPESYENQQTSVGVVILRDYGAPGKATVSRNPDEANPKRPPKKWWDMMVRKIGHEYPGRTKEAISNIVGGIWYHNYSKGAKRSVTMASENPKTKTISGKQIVNELMNEVILYGGIPMRRCDVYTDALATTGSHKAADMFAFGLNTKPVDAEPWSLERFRALARSDNPMKKTRAQGRLDPATAHAIDVARRTLNTPDAIANYLAAVSHAPTKEQAREILRSHGITPKGNPSAGRYYVVSAVPTGVRESYPLSEVKAGTRVKLLEHAPAGGLDVVDVKVPGEKETKSVYAFQLSKHGIGVKENPMFSRARVYRDKIFLGPGVMVDMYNGDVSLKSSYGWHAGGTAANVADRYEFEVLSDQAKNDQPLDQNLAGVLYSYITSRFVTETPLTEFHEKGRYQRTRVRSHPGYPTGKGFAYPTKYSMNPVENPTGRCPHCGASFPLHGGRMQCPRCYMPLKLPRGMKVKRVRYGGNPLVQKPVPSGTAEMDIDGTRHYFYNWYPDKRSAVSDAAKLRRGGHYAVVLPYYLTMGKGADVVFCIFSDMVGNPTRKNVELAAHDVGLTVRTWSPGDGVTRYRFFKDNTRSYFGGDGIHTVLGAKEAMMFLEGYGRGAGKMNPQMMREDGPVKCKYCGKMTRSITGVHPECAKKYWSKPGDFTTMYNDPTFVKSKGHIGLFQYNGTWYELFKDGLGELFRAPVSNVIDLSTGYRLARWEAPAWQADEQARILLGRQ